MKELKHKIPEGKCELYTFTSEYSKTLVGQGIYTSEHELAKVAGRTDDEAIKTAKLFAEAYNVANETGLTPRQLLEQRNELLEALVLLYNACPNDGTWRHPAALNNAFNVITKCQPTSKG